MNKNDNLMLKSASLSPTIMNDSALILKSYFKFIMAANEFFFIKKKKNIYQCIMI